MKYCINNDEGELIFSNGLLCHHCLFKNFPMRVCIENNICDSTHIIIKSKNTSPIFTL